MRGKYSRRLYHNKKYKGFYVGRYETGGFNGTVAISKKGISGTTSSSSTENSINHATWYKMYKIQKDYASQKYEVGSSMIWGSQWDQVMKFVNGKKDGTGKDYIVTLNSITPGRHTNSLAPTGSNIKDFVQNFYDLEGNVSEWTLEAMITYSRTYRGGNYAFTTNGENNAALRNGTQPDSASAQYGGSRMTLYIK